MSPEQGRRVLRGLFAVSFLICLGLGIADPFFSVYASSLGATGFHLAILFSGYAAAKTAFSPLSGWWSDRRGRRTLLLAGLCVYGACSLGYLFCSDLFQVILLRLFQGFAAALVRPIALATVGDLAPPHREGTVMGTFDISFYSAFAVGPVLGGIIKDAYGFPGIFFSLFLLCFLSFVTALLYVKSPANGNGRAQADGRLDVTVLKRNRLLLALCGFIFSRSFGIVFFAIFMPIYMHDQLRFRGIEIGMVMGASTILTALLLRPMGRLSDWVGRNQLIVIGGGAAALFTSCLPLAESFPALLALSIGIGMGSVVSLPASSALLVEEGNRFGMGLTMGIFNGAMNLGFVLAPLAGGLAFGLWGIQAVFYAAGLIGFAGSLFYLLCANRQLVPVKEDPSPGPVQGQNDFPLSKKRVF